MNLTMEDLGAFFRTMAEQQGAIVAQGQRIDALNAEVEKITEAYNKLKQEYYDVTRNGGAPVAELVESQEAP